MSLLSAQVYLHEISTCVPPKSYTQDFTLEFLLHLQGTSPRKREFLQKIYQHSAIHKRHTVIEDYDKDPADYKFYPRNASLKPEPSTARRNEEYIKAADLLSVQAVRGLLERLPDVAPDSVTHLITVSCTGFSAPGFDIYVMKELGFSPSLHRLHIGFMGCYAAIPALRMARDICLANPDARVVIVNLELCSLHFQQKFDPDTVVANAIFADGVSAALVSAKRTDSRGPVLAIQNTLSHFIAESEDDMAWKIGEHGFDMKLSLYVPRFIELNIAKITDALFEKVCKARSDIGIWAIHPGGRAILEKVEEALALDTDALQVSYDILREYGNMSSATIMFVLERILADDREGGVFAAAFGPGLTVECCFFEKFKVMD